MRVLVVFLMSLVSFQLGAQCLEGDCENGTGKFSCDCGYIFEGQFKNGEKVKGVLTKKDLVYTGEFKNDVAEGYGIIRYKDGSWYEGMFQSNAPHGYGTYFFASGRTYVGEMKEGYFGGLGVLTRQDHDGNIIDQQMGEFSRDRLTGIGCIVASGGDLYLGTLEDGEYMGFGVFIFGKTQTAEAGIFRKKRLQEDVVMMNYPKPQFYAVKDFVVDDVTYNLTGNVHGSQMLIRVENATNQNKRIYFDKEQQVLFISASGDASYGTAINFKGEIFSAMFDEKAATPVTFEKKKYVK